MRAGEQGVFQYQLAALGKSTFFTYLVCLICAIATHVILLSGWQHFAIENPEYAIKEVPTSMELELIDTSPTNEPIQKPEETIPMAESKIETREPITEPLPLVEQEKPKPLVVESKEKIAEPGINKIAVSVPSSKAANQTRAMPDYLQNPPPIYPSMSRQNREEGVVMLNVFVSDRGRVTSLGVKQSSGYPRLDSAAIAAVNRWRFKPARLNTTAIASQVEVPVRFKLHN